MASAHVGASLGPGGVISQWWESVSKLLFHRNSIGCFRLGHPIPHNFEEVARQGKNPPILSQETAQ
jgi:hypothetical protein